MVKYFYQVTCTVGSRTHAAVCRPLQKLVDVAVFRCGWSSCLWKRQQEDEEDLLQRGRAEEEPSTIASSGKLYKLALQTQRPPAAVGPPAGWLSVASADPLPTHSRDEYLGTAGHTGRAPSV